MGMGKVKAKARKELAYIMLVIGPARDIFTISFCFCRVPPIIMAPGAIILIGKNTEANVNRAPHVVKRNSAHKPFF